MTSHWRQFVNRIGSNRLALIIIVSVLIVGYIHFGRAWNLEETTTDKNAKGAERANYFSKFDNKDAVPQDDLSNEECPRVTRLFTEFRECTRVKLERLAEIYADPKHHGQQLWDEFTDMSMLCGGGYLASTFDLQVIQVPRDAKAVIYPINKNDPIESVTLGIGKDITIEKELQKSLPNIHFYGLDPFNSSAYVFHEIGKVFQVGIGRTTGKRRSYVLQDRDDKRVYEWQTIETITLPDLLRKVDQPLVDFLFMDVEGGEYSVLPEQIVEVEKEGRTICQMCIEMHGPIEKYGGQKTDFTKFINYLFSPESAYLPLWMPPPNAANYGHHHFHLMNWRNEECVEKYLKKYC